MDIIDYYPPFRKTYCVKCRTSYDTIKTYKICNEYEICDLCVSTYIRLDSENFSIMYPDCPSLKKVLNNRVTYNNTQKMSIIKRNVNKLEVETCRTKKNIKYYQRKYDFICGIETYLKRKVNENKDIYLEFLRIIQDEKDYFNSDFNILLKYYHSIPDIKSKYENLLDAHKKKNICFECFSDYGIYIKHYKNRRYCDNCLVNIKDKTLFDCSVCITENITKCKMVKINCGNEHYVCNTCFKNLKKYSDRCPLCRGQL
jgi:hypothetical protein